MKKYSSILLLSFSLLSGVAMAGGTTAGCCANVATGSAAHRATDHVTASCAQRAADSGLTTLALVGAQGTACRAAQACANGAAGATTNGVAHYRAEYPTQCAANAGLGGAACHGTPLSKLKDNNKIEEYFFIKRAS